MIQNYFRWTRLRVPFLAAIMVLLSLHSRAVSNGDVFIRISSLSELSNGDEIIFVNQAETHACGTTQNTNNRDPEPISVSNHSYTYASKDKVQVFVVRINANGNYGFHAGSGYIYSGSSESNSLKTNSTLVSYTPSGTSAWKLSVSNYVFTISNLSNKSFYLAFNGTSYFSQYTSGQSKPYIYKKTLPENVTVGSAGYTAYVTSKSVRFPEGVTGYIATANTGETLTLTSRASVPSGTPVIIKAASGSYDLPVTTTPESVGGNLLLASDGTVTGNGSIYALGLGKTGENAGKVGFYVVKTGVNVPAGKAYLDLSGSDVKEFLMFDFDNEETGIRETANVECRMSNTIFDMSGRRIKDSHLKRGIYVMNGKKVVIK